MHQESKRIQKFKGELIKDLPFFPNDKKTKKELEVQHLDELLFNYIHWAIRRPPPRPRRVIIAPEVTNDVRWKILSASIKAFLKKVSNGDDLTPHLSKTTRKGYTPPNRIAAGDAGKWDDKDFLLNTRGFHHFHLGQSIGSNDMVERTDDVLFAFVDRNVFHAVGIFDHNVFEAPDQNRNSCERERMWQIHEKHVTKGMKPGTVYMANPITLSGHPVFIHNLKRRYAQAIYDIDPQLDDKAYVSDLYQKANMKMVKEGKLEWCLMRMDLGLYNKDANCFFRLMEWPF